MTDSHDRLFIGTRRYSSWSLRGWLAVRLAGLDVVDEVIPLKGAGQTAEIHALSPNKLVPYLEHQGARVWESLAICEYCADLNSALWPAGRIERACARSISSEMHAGFRAVRQAFPMNLGRIGKPRASLDEAVAVDVSAIDRIWQTTLEQFGGEGPFLFGSAMTVPDIMFAPVVTRFYSYGVEVSDVSVHYMEAVRAHPLMQEWSNLARTEDPATLLALYEELP